jgi:hypothetical protein
MRCYLSSPGSLAHAHACGGLPVLISFAYAPEWLLKVAHSFGRVLFDSGAYTAWTQGKSVDLDRYAETARTIPWADAAASLDSIKGKWREGLANWDRYPWMFPVYHDSDPPEALDAILERLQDRDVARFRPSSPQWIGLGMTPPRTSRRWLSETLVRLPPGLHVHGFALRGHADMITTERGADCSFDSINWWMDSRQVLADYPWLTPTECLEIVVKRYEREFKTRPEKRVKGTEPQLGLFSDAACT